MTENILKSQGLLAKQLSVQSPWNDNISVDFASAYYRDTIVHVPRTRLIGREN